MVLLVPISEKTQFYLQNGVANFGMKPMDGIWVTPQITCGLIWGPNLNGKCSPYPNWDPNPNPNHNRNHWLSNRSKPKLSTRCKVIMTYNIQFPVHGQWAG